MNKGTALITGGRGFIGRALVMHLEGSGWKVSVLDQAGRNGRSTLASDSLDQAVRDVDVVYHLAGVLGTTELNELSAMAVDVNIRGTVNVLDACLRTGIPRVFICTKPNDWLNTYSITKKAGEDFGGLYAKCFGLDVRILRWLNVYGPGQKTHPVRKAVPTMLLQALHGRPIEVFGSGAQPVDLIHVDDLARITVAYVSSDEGDCTIRDTGLSVRMTVNELAVLIRTVTNSSSEIIHLPMRPGEDETEPIRPLDIPTACELLDATEPPMDVAEGFRETAEYYAALPEDHAMSALDWHANQRVFSGSYVQSA